MDLSLLAQYQQWQSQQTQTGGGASSTQSTLAPPGPPPLPSSVSTTSTLPIGSIGPPPGMQFVPLSLSVLDVCALNPNDGKVRIGIDSGAGVTVWPRDLCNDGRPTMETPESRSGIGYLGAQEGAPSIKDEGCRQYRVVDGQQKTRDLKVRVANVRKPLLAVADLNDLGHDVVFPATARGLSAFARDARTGETTSFERRNRVFEYAVDVLPHGAARTQSGFGWQVHP